MLLLTHPGCHYVGLGRTGRPGIAVLIKLRDASLTLFGYRPSLL